jgi:acetate---CoA ligase (ADP-forming)
MTVGGRPLVRDVILRDGTPLRLRTPAPADYRDIKAFYDRLSEDSLYTRFHGSVRTEGPARTDAEADGDARVLIGWRAGRVVASGSYDRLREPAVAEVAFTVAEDFQGRGVATRMLEQLAQIGAERGIARFDAEVMDSNQAMLAVFRRAGFGVRNRLDFDELLVSLDIQPTAAVQEKIEERDHLGVIASLRPILAPASVAVVGASNEPGSRGGELFANLIGGGFRGAAVPVNRSEGVVRSVRAARSLSELAEPPELVVVAVPDEEVLDVAAQAARIGARALLVVSRLADTAGQDTGRQRQLLEIVQEAEHRQRRGHLPRPQDRGRHRDHSAHAAAVTHVTAQRRSRTGRGRAWPTPGAPCDGLTPTRRSTRVSSASHCLPRHGRISPRHSRPG